MAIEYQYTEKTTSPNLTGIHSGVAASTMVDKTLDYCSWNDDDCILHVFFTNALDAGDKTELDTIVSSNS